MDEPVGGTRCHISRWLLVHRAAPPMRAAAAAPPPDVRENEPYNTKTFFFFFVSLFSRNAKYKLKKKTGAAYHH